MGLKSHPKFDLMLLERKVGQGAKPVRQRGTCEQRHDMITSVSDTQN